MSDQRRPARFKAVAAALLLAAACSRGSTPGPPSIRLVDAPSPAPSFVEVAGVDRAVLNSARAFSADDPRWATLLRVHIVGEDGAPAALAMAGQYAVAEGSLRFTPAFPFDPGRKYRVSYLATGGPPIEHAIELPPRPPAAPTSVTHVYPSGDVLPENQLRMYIHFSAPMGRRGGVEHVRLLDEHGREVTDPFLPLDAEFWNHDRTRYTLFFDPGRQKRGIRPNREMGPSLVAGRRYTFVVEREWLDGEGNPLRESFTRPFRVVRPDQDAIDPSGWQVDPPTAGSRDRLAVTFPTPLDHGLLLRALGVSRNGRTIQGETTVDRQETRWLLTPQDAWQAGEYELTVLSILEDRAGNRIGRPFEIESFERTNQPREPTSVSVRFSIR